MICPDIEELLALQRQAKVLQFASNSKTKSKLAGNYASVFRGRGMEFDEVRQYVAGDDVRNIDWRVTARTNIPHLKVFKEERERSVIICVDASAHMQFGTRGTFKAVQAARAVALLGWGAAHNNDKVGGLVVGNVKNGMKFYKPSNSRHAFFQMLKLLSEEDTYKTTKTDNSRLDDAVKAMVKTVTTGSLIFIIADFNHIGSEFEKNLSALSRKCKVVLLPVCDPADGNIEALGSLVFINDEQDKVILDTSNAKGRRAYLASWQNWQKLFSDITVKFNVPVIWLYTNQDVYECLVAGLNKMKASKVRG